MLTLKKVNIQTLKKLVCVNEIVKMYLIHFNSQCLERLPLQSSISLKIK